MHRCTGSKQTGAGGVSLLHVTFCPISLLSLEGLLATVQVAVANLHKLLNGVCYACCCPMQEMTEQMVSQMVLELKGSYKIQYHVDGPDKDPIEIDFTPPW